MPDSFLDFSYARLADPLLRALRRTALSFAGMQPGQSALDVCCGTGAQVFEYSKNGLEATGLDLDPKMLRQTDWYRARLPELKPAFVLGDATSMPFSDSAFDFASISLAMHEHDEHFQDAVLSEMRRVVKTGGKLVLIDFRAPLPRSLVGCGINIIESLAGADNSKNFHAYIDAGGLSAIMKRHSLSIERQRQAVSGSVELQLVAA